MIRILEAKQAKSLLKRKSARMEEAEGIVRPILEGVRKHGDKALLEYARKFDSLDRKSVRVPQAELAESARRLSPAFRRALKTAGANIRAYAKTQIPAERHAELSPGIRLGQIVRPLDTVAAYIPSGRYPLPSTLLMTVIPAQVAGVPNICVATPRIVDEIWGTASILKASHVFQMGGAHAIAAFAFGTRTVPRADRIVGPGSIYVAAAKKLLAGEVGIDFVAGPTEILLIAEDGDPVILAADMLAQAEHDTDASAILLTPSRSLGEAVAQEIEKQLETLPTAETARVAIRKNSAILIVDSIDHAVDLANQFAPEHLSVPSRAILGKIRHAGSVFIGKYSPEAAGDYASGPNHVLPTNGAARLRGGLSAADYVKVISVQELSRKGLESIRPSVTTLARAEGLEAHARSVEVRENA